MNNLLQSPVWTCWRFDSTKGKIPYNPRTGEKAKTNDINTACKYDEAVRAKNVYKYDGIGFLFYHGICGIDIDIKGSHNTQETRQTARTILNIFKDTYIERSPSGTGYHILFRCDVSKIPVENGKLNSMYYMKNPHNGLECYISGLTKRFFTFTGNCVSKSQEITDRTQELLLFLDTYMLKGMRSDQDSTPAPLPDNDLNIIGVLNKARKAKNGQKFIQLYDYGDTSQYNNDDSSADQALCNILAYWFHGDFNDIDTAFKNSKLYRDKWNRQDYKSQTINNAIKSCNGNYHKSEIDTSAGSISIISAPELQQANLPPTKFLVDNILPEGTSMISAPSKIGKSWFVLDMGLAIASGTPFMKYNTHQNGVLYLALEDSLTRLKDRMNKILTFTQPPKSFYFTTKAPNLDNGLLNELDQVINAHPEIKLIIVDTLQKIRGLSQGREAAYAQDYREMGALKEYADTRKISIFFVHHTRKMKDEGDPFNMISGTNGIMGVADTIFTLLKDKRQDKNAVLHITGRDVEQVDDVVNFNTCTWKWETIGSQEQIEKLEELSHFNANPIVITVKALLDESKSNYWSGTCAELMEAGEQYTDEPLSDSTKKLGYDLRKLQEPLMRIANIHMSKTKNGNAGNRYGFQLRKNL